MSLKSTLETDRLAETDPVDDYVLIELENEELSKGGIAIHHSNPKKAKIDGILRGRVLKVGPDAQNYVAPGRLIHAWQYYEPRGSVGARGAEIIHVKGGSRIVAYVPLPNVILEIADNG